MKISKCRISLLLGLLLLSLLLIGCTTDTGTDPTTNPESTTEEVSTLPEEPESLDLITGGNSLIRIVRRDEASDNEISAAQSIYKALKSICPNAEVKFVSDFDSAKTYDPDVVEILVGYTNYPESEIAMTNLTYGDYGTRIIGKKVVLASWQDVTYSLLAQNFCSTLKKGLSADGLTLTLHSASTGTRTYNEMLSALPSVDGKAPSAIYNSGDSAYQILLADSTPEEYEAYCQKLERASFTLHQKREVNGNRFSTYENRNTAVTVYHTPFISNLRIIVEPIANLFKGEDGIVSTAVTPKLTMIGRKHSNGSTYMDTNADSGLMCFVLQLSDGRFIVIDGGVATTGVDSSFAAAIYKTMLEQAPDKNDLTIAAWVITHTHGDHTGGFCVFAQTYSQNVTVERVMYNFPNEADAKPVGEDGNIRKVASAISTYYPDTPVHKVHTGQNFMIGDAEFEFYYTHEDYLLQHRTITDNSNWNNTSLIFSVKLGGNRIMFLGDSQTVPNNQTVSMFGDYLKCDIVQVAHHGGEGGTKAIYKAVDASIALFSTSDELLPVYINHFDFNYYLVKLLNVKEYYNSADRITTWELPYTAKGSGFLTEVPQ